MFHVSQTTHIATFVLCGLYKFILDLLKTYNKCYSGLLESLNMLLHSRVVFFSGRRGTAGCISYP